MALYYCCMRAFTGSPCLKAASTVLWDTTWGHGSEWRAEWRALPVGTAQHIWEVN